MFKCINLSAFLSTLIEQTHLVPKAMLIIQGILAACSPRLSRIAEHMPGRPAANYKMIQHFLVQVDLKAVLMRFFQEDAEFVIEETFLHRGGVFVV